MAIEILWVLAGVLVLGGSGFRLWYRKYKYSHRKPAPGVPLHDPDRQRHYQMMISFEPEEAEKLLGWEFTMGLRRNTNVYVSERRRAMKELLEKEGLYYQPPTIGGLW